ncbi:putative F-box/LRR-repeat protein 23 [Vicia villosa]|uniref:putative F-box/LRR-repeat protein 23 n=1 Tax=Vicia villosa TaxID=3911 RepID=UPI00273B55E4|nr:putative F-box/LRR-repeat protein 23 [Vicia villosa]
MAYLSIPSTEVEMETIAGPNWLELPRDVTANILQRLETIELLTSACQVCPLWWNICKDPHMWRTISITYYRYKRHPDNNAEMLCRNAIKRSCGQLESIDIELFATNDLIAYIADRKLPYLESLDISFVIKLTKDSFEAVGRYCPLLKSLICNTTHYDNGVLCAIGKTMPGLHHLKMFGKMPTDVELLPIIDGCPLLESLDLSECFYESFEYRESLEKMCRENIKDFRPPSQVSCYNYDSDCDSETESEFSSLFSYQEFESAISRIRSENWDGELTEP